MMQSNKTFTNRSNARRAGVQAGIPVEQVEITVHKNKGEVRFGFKRAEAVVTEKKAKTAAPAVTTPATKKESATKVERESRQGIKRPAPGGRCALIWQWLDEHPNATVKDAKAALPDQNQNNVACEFYQWRKFNGVTVARPPARRIDGEVDQLLA